MASKSLFFALAQVALLQMSLAQVFPGLLGNSFADNRVAVGELGFGSFGNLGNQVSIGEFGLGGLNNFNSFGNTLGNQVAVGEFGASGLGGMNLGSNLLGYGSGVSTLASGPVGLGLGYGGVSSVAAPVGISSATLAGFGGYNIVAGSPLAVTTISPFGPSGLAVASENSLEGILNINGQLPYLSAVAFEGALPTAGSGVATCGCGNGQVGIIGEGPVVLGQPGLGLGNRILY